MADSSTLRLLTSEKDDQRVLCLTVHGYKVLVGKNSESNERIIREHPHRDCVWFHAMAATGSHVILCVDQKPEPEEAVIQEAARLALKNSHSQARTVSISRLRDVFKPHGAGIGIWKTLKGLSLEA